MATSRVVSSARFDTLITKFDAGPEPVRAGRPVTLRGQLHRLAGPKWTTFAGQRVELYFRAKGTKVPEYAGSVRSDSTGQFAARFAARKDGYWAAVWWTPNGKYVSAFSVEDYVDVR